MKTCIAKTVCFEMQKMVSSPPGGSSPWDAPIENNAKYHQFRVLQQLPQHSLAHVIPWKHQFNICVLERNAILPTITDSVFHKKFLNVCTVSSFRKWQQTAVLFHDLWKHALRRYSPLNIMNLERNYWEMFANSVFGINYVTATVKHKKNSFE